MLADEYELRIGKKGHILDHIWEYCNQVHNKNYEWHNYEFENEECEEIGIEDKDYHPLEVRVETFEAKKYSFKGGQSFICVTKDLDNTLPLGRKNGSKWKEMIRREIANNKTIQKLGGNYRDRLDSYLFGNYVEIAAGIKSLLEDKGLITINGGLIQAIPTSLPPQPIREATKASNLQRIPPGV
ncbi:hypothetical protein Tco_0001128 [Tanacetum coccineum]